jgi:3-hydroxyisobutyrate dehydrogenase
MANAETVAVLGAGGTMGAAMARNLARAGFAVRAWNRSREKAEPLAGDGAQVTGTPAEAATGAGVVLTMLSDGDAVIAAMEGDDGALAQAGEGTVWLQMSTIGEAATERCAEIARGARVAFVDAPVLGTRQPAEEGALVVMASGPEEVRERVQPLLDAVGKRTMWVGEAGRGTLLKLVTNSWIMAVVEGGAETIALAEGLGLDPALLLEAIEGGPLDLPYLRIKAAAIADRDFTPSFRLALAAKDAALVQESAERRGLELPLVEVIRARLQESVPGHGDEDVVATYWASAPTT